MHKLLLAGLVFLFTVCECLSHSTFAGVWVELGDAGRLPASAQVTDGISSLTSISGNLVDELDIDVFKILLTGGGTFSATTVGLSLVDTRLFLFDAAGLGVYANDDANVFTLQSELPAGDPLTPLVPGTYYLAVAGFEINPVSISGRIFLDPLFPEELLSPIGPGGGSPVNDFEGAGDFGAYTINLTGALFAESSVAAVPEPSTCLIWLVGGSIIGLVRSGRSCFPGQAGQRARVLFATRY